MNFEELKIVRKLATGGMAELYLARQKMVGDVERDVVLKRILPEFAADPEFIRSFLNEARLIARLNHPNIVQIYDVGKSGKAYFMTMEYLQGYDLGQLIAHHQATRSSIPLDVATSILLDTLSGLECAHHSADFEGNALGVVHRDVTPSNVIVRDDGRAKLIDFGIAKATALGDKRTATGTVKGKLPYLAPEQVLSLPIDRRVDVYAVGVVAYELLTTQHPFRGDNDYKTLENILELALPPINELRQDLPPALSAAIMQALDRPLAGRHASCADFAAALREATRSMGLDHGPEAVREYLHSRRADLVARQNERDAKTQTLTRADERPLAGRWALLFVALALLGATTWWYVTRSPPAPIGQAKEVPRAEPMPVTPMTEATRLTPPTIAMPTAKKSPHVDVRPGQLRLIVEPWAYVKLDGQDLGVTPMAVRELKPGPHTLTLSNPGLHKELQQKIVIRAGEEFVVRQDLGRP